MAIELTPSLPLFHRSGRWSQSAASAVSGPGSLIASWASASISFLLTGSSLSLRLGPQTHRRCSLGANSTTLVCSLSDPGHPSISAQVLTFDDPEPGVLPLFDRLENGQQKLVEVTLVDWSSVLELVSIVVDSVDVVQPQLCPPPRSRLLFIGGSICCGYSYPPGLIPKGSLDAFTARSAAHLGVPSDTIAYPGITLVDPEASGVSFVHNEPGMISRFFIAGSSPYDDTPASLDERPTIIVIALGTNDRGIGVEPTFFAQTMCAFVSRLADIYHETLQHICILHPFPCFGVTEEQPAFAHAISKVVDQVTEDRPRLGLHVWDLGGSVLNEDLTIDQLHPTLQGHILLGEALAGLLRPLIGGA